MQALGVDRCTAHFLACSARVQWFWPGTRLSLLTAAVGFWVLTAALRVFWPAAHLRVSRLENAIVDAFLVVGRSRETAPASSRGGLLYCGGMLDLDLGQRRHPYGGCRLYLSFTFRCLCLVNQRGLVFEGLRDGNFIQSSL